MSIIKKISKTIGITAEDEAEETEGQEKETERKSSGVTDIGSRTRRPETGANLSGFPDFSSSTGGTSSAAV